MALISADRVRETTTTTGTGAVTLSGAVTGFLSFSTAVGVGNTCYYAIVAQTAGEWEVGLGTLSAGTTLTRTTVYASSNAGAAVTFSAGTKDVFVTLAASKTVQLDSSGNLSVSGTVNATTLQQGGVGASLVGHTHSYEPTIAAGTTAQYWRGDKSWQTLDKTAVGLSAVENTALSTWAGSANIVTVGTIATGTWNATAIADGKIASALTGKTYNGLTLTAAATGFTIAGGTTSKTLTMSNTLTFTGTDSSSVAFGAGGTVLYNGGALGTPSSGNLANCTFPTLNQNTTGSAATLTTSRSIHGGSFNGSADVTNIIASTYGGTGNGFTKFSGPTTAEKTFTLPNATATILTDNAAVTVAQGGTGRATSTTAYGIIAAGTTATGAHQTIDPGAISGYVLTSNGAAALPTFQAPSSSGATAENIRSRALMGMI